MKRALVLIVLCAAFLTTCRKDCEKNITGNINFTNNTSRNLEVYMNGALEFTAGPNANVVTNDVRAGNRDFEIKDASNDSTLRTGTVRVVRCETNIFTYP